VWILIDVPVVGHLGISQSKVGCYSGTAGICKDVTGCYGSCDFYQRCHKITVGLKLVWCLQTFPEITMYYCSQGNSFFKTICNYANTIIQ